jgi:hypothetical protein
MQKESYLAGAKPNQVGSRKKVREDFAQPLTYEMCLKCLSFLEPITMQIKLYERNATPLSEVLLCFTNLRSAIETNNLLTVVEKQFIKGKIADRKAFIQQNFYDIRPQIYWVGNGDYVSKAKVYRNYQYGSSH